MRISDLVCPFCKTRLEPRGRNELCCQLCAKGFPIIHGIPSFEKSIPAEVQECFTGQHQQVARTRAESQRRSVTSSLREKIEANPGGRQLLYGLLFHRFRLDAFIQRTLARLPGRSVILDLGCAHGDERYCRFGEVVGLDASLWALHTPRARSYSLRVHGDALSLPFPDGAFDCVISRAFYGHIPSARKDALLDEVSRVLKPGGKYVLDIESGTAGAHRFLARDPDLYKQFLRGHYGVWGFEEIEEALVRMRRHQMRPLEVEKLWGWVWATASYAEWFDNAYRRKSRAFSSWVGFCKLLSKSRLLQVPADVALGVLSRLENRLISTRQAVEVMVVVEREAVEATTATRRSSVPGPVGRDRQVAGPAGG